MTTTSLPPDWNLMLKRIDLALTQAIQLAEAREAALAGAAPARDVPILPADLLSKHIQELDKRIAEMEAPLRNFDRTFQGEEEGVRDHLGKVADLRQRLADWTARAIG